VQGALKEKVDAIECESGNVEVQWMWKCSGCGSAVDVEEMCAK
jgi:hypothetical protein